MVQSSNQLQQAYSYLEGGEYLQAAALLEKEYENYPDNKFIRGKLVTAYLRAAVKIETDNVTEAENCIKRAAAIDQSNSNVQISYIKFLERHGRKTEAAHRKRDFIDIDKGDLSRQFLLAKKAFDNRKFAESVQLVEKIIKADPSHQLANALLPSACYRAGLYSHPILEQERRKQASPPRFIDGLANVAEIVGIDDALLPDRNSWTGAQRYMWGRRIDALIRDQILGGPTFQAEVQRYMRPFSMPVALQNGSAVIFMLHVGTIHLSINQVLASGIPFKHVTNSLPLGVAFSEKIIDVVTIPSNALLARMAGVLRNGACVTVAIDGPIGQRVDGFMHLGVEYSIAAGPLALASMMRARTYLLTSWFEERKLACQIVEGPDVKTSLQELQSFWGNAIRQGVKRVTKFGPENFVQHESSNIKALTTNPYRPK